LREAPNLKKGTRALKVLMVTNTYTPIIGGVERSIIAFTDEFRKLGHDVLILAPKFNNMPKSEKNVIRVSALRRFNGSDFSVRIPIPAEVDKVLRNFKPDIVHSHHPFLLGDTALRIANKNQAPLVFTHHTKYEDYTHYVPGDSKAMKKFVIELSTGYAQLADHVFAPSQSIADLIRARGVTTPVTVVPTGVDFDRFAQGSGDAFRQKYNLVPTDFVVGHVGRLAVEKNLIFLCKSLVSFLKQHQNTRFLLIGKGPLEEIIKEIFNKEGLSSRLLMTGVLQGQELIDAYHAMDVFAFSSLTETQGMVLTEAMAASVPVVAIDASGVREVLNDKINGRMLSDQNETSFFEGLNWIYERSKEEKESLKQESMRTAQEISIEKTVQKALNVYNSLIIKDFVYTDIENSSWSQAMFRLRTEWDLISNVAEAFSSVFHHKKISERYDQSFIIKCKRFFNSNEWTARLLGLSKSSNTEVNPGLVLIQIDGVSEKQLKMAIKKGNMPFLQRLLRKELYQTHSFYSGQPSSTPGVQAELFYGVKGAVPSFSFLDKDTCKIFKMIDDESALKVEKQLQQRNTGLLQGGSSYSNIYSGGALESHFCSVDFGWDKLWRQVKPLRLCLLTIIHGYSILLTAMRIILELILSVLEFLKGLLTGKDFKKELKFIPTRLAICILLRDLITFGAKIDIIRGLPIIHLNFLGYDEHAHRRGPSSRFAHWTLLGIDRCIAKIFKESLRSTRRSYDVWVYSDHGQEENNSYTAEYKKSIHEKIQEVFSEYSLERDTINDCDQMGIHTQRIRYFGYGLFNKIIPFKHLRQTSIDKHKLVVTAMGPVGHIYLPRSLKEKEQHEFAQRLVKNAHIPLVLAKEENNTVAAWNNEGKFILPADGKHVFGVTHPFINEVTEDMIRNCNHKNAGDFIISGWKPNEKPYSFPIEGGSHGGPGINETNGFALIPSDVQIKNNNINYIRPVELRDTALNFIKRFKENTALSEKTLVQPKTKRQEDLIRIMTYNVHGCKGLDGKISVERIARVIARYNPDIVALRELDINRARSGEVDQPHLIAQYLEMIHHFYPSLGVEEEQYGNAVLSRFPIKCVKAKRLPCAQNKESLEPRGAMWTEISINGTRMQFFNTHLGLDPNERDSQVKELLSKNWLDHPSCKGPVILSGDFNASGKSSVCSMIKKRLYDARIEMTNHRPKVTWLGHFLLKRIDHVFLNSDFEVVGVEVADAQLAKIASDHLPLIVDVKLKQNRGL